MNRLRVLLLGLAVFVIVMSQFPCQSSRLITTKPPTRKESVEGEGVVCEVCMWICKKIEDFLAENKTESEIEVLLADLCSIAISYKTCKEIVDNYIPFLVHLIRLALPPNVACYDVLLCPNPPPVWFGNSEDAPEKVDGE